MFPRLVFRSLECSYRSAAEPLLRDLSVTFEVGWTGLVGSNGSGKTTLLKLIAGELECEECLIDGSVQSSGSVLLCSQDTSLAPSRLSEFWESHDRYAWHLREALELREIQADLWHEQSPGQQKRLQVAVALWGRPEILLLDEPTNHLDGVSRALLVTELRRFPGIGILVSHDRTLLDELCRSVLWLRDGTGTLRSGGYSSGHAVLQLEDQTKAKAYEEARRERSRLDREWKRRVRVADEYARARSKRGLDKHDSDGRGRIDLAIFTGKDNAQHRLKKRFEKRVNDADAVVAESAQPRRFQTGVRFPVEQDGPRLAAFMESQRLPLPSGGELALPTLSVVRGDRIGVVGPNGSGKSTLLRALAASLAAGSRRFEILPQEFSSVWSQQIITELREASLERKGRLMTIIRRLGSDPAAVLASAALSFGEARKLWIADALERRSPILLLDEPTNHLDLTGIEAIEQGLADYEGTLVVVSHDERLIGTLTKRLWRVEGGEVRESRVDDRSGVSRDGALNQ